MNYTTQKTFKKLSINIIICFQNVLDILSESPRADLDIKIDVWQSFKFLNKAF